MVKASIILPVYNESKYIGSTFESVLEYSMNYPCYQFIFVNDGSTDGSQYILKKYIDDAESNQIELISYDQNKGKGYAIKKGVESSIGDYICFIDSDLAYSLTHLEFLVDKLEIFDVVIGCRNLIFDNFKRVSLIRLFAGKTFNFMTQSILSLHFSDMQAGLKGFKRDIAKNLFEKQTIQRFCFDVELIYLAQKRGYKIGEIPAIVSNTHLAKVSKVNLLIDSIRMLQSLLQIKINDSLGLYEEVCTVKF
ncbi:glycosyltransferase [Allocoleopsis sp.]|uniref:glycosyltransferase n=1 Tax=Allocoleopsis sp. TaxID=3088169 RepID=UPI002FD297B4